MRGIHGNGPFDGARNSARARKLVRAVLFVAGTAGWGSCLPVCAHGVPEEADDSTVVAGDPAESNFPAESHWGFGLALARDEARDDLLVPMRWSGPGPGLRLEWERATGARRHRVTLLFPASFFENRFGHAGYGLGLEAEYGYVRTISEDFRNGHLCLGGRAKWDVHHGYYESWDEEHIYWFAAYSLGPQLAWIGPKGENTRFSAELDLPLIALVSRPPRERLNRTDRRTQPSFYFTSIHEDMKWAGPGDYSGLHAGVSVARKWGGSALIFSYDLEIATYDEPERVVTLSNRFSVVRRGW